MAENADKLDRNLSQVSYKKTSKECRTIWIVNDFEKNNDHRFLIVNQYVLVYVENELQQERFDVFSLPNVTHTSCQVIDQFQLSRVNRA